MRCDGDMSTLHSSVSHSPFKINRNNAVGADWPQRALHLAVAAAIGSMAATARAQVDEAKAGEAQSMVVTGSLQAQRIGDAPFAIATVGAEELRSAGPMINLSEALARVPGLVVANRNNYTQDLQISSRGFGARATFGVRGLRLYADGIPATMPDGQGQVAHFDLAGAQRIEVLRGPFSVLYGNSSGGVIAVFAAPATESRLEFGLDAGSAGLRQERLRFGSPLGNGFDVQGSLSNVELDGFRPQASAHRTLGNLRLGWRGDQDRVTVQLSDHLQSAQDPLGLTAAQFAANPYQTTAVARQFDTRKTIRQTQGGLNWRHSFANDSGLRETAVTLYQGSRGVTQWLAITPAVQANARHGGGVVDFDRDYSGAELRANFAWGGLGLVLGLNRETLIDERRGFENFTGSGAAQVLGVTGKLRRDETNRATTREAFGQGEWSLSQAVAVTGGVRSGRVDMTVRDRYLGNGDDSGALAFSYTNPALGLRWKVQPGWTLHASAARGFESPTLGELAYRPDANAGLNLGLKGQTSRQFELGSKWRVDGIELDAAAFSAHTENEIAVQTNNGGRSAFQNVGRTQRQGLELSARWKPAQAWRLQAAATWLDATYLDGFLTCTAAPCPTPNVRVDAGRRIAGTQKATAWAEAAWQPNWMAGVTGELALEWRAIGRTVANDTNSDSAAGYAVANLRWRASFAVSSQDSLEVLARVDNLFDRVHAASLIVNEANGRFFEPGMARSGLVSLRWSHRW